jgi:O-antigen/teichoic acid export membrane protein
MAPLMMGLTFMAEPLVRLLLTEKWHPCVFFLRIFCITYMFFPIHTSNLNAIKAMGRSDLFLKLEIWKKATGLLILIPSMLISVKAMAYSTLITSVLGQIINSWPNRKLLHYGYLEQLKDILPGILLAVFMGICIYPVSMLHLPDILTIFIQFIAGAIIYIVLSAVLKLESFQYLWDFLLGTVMNKRKGKEIGK